MKDMQREILSQVASGAISAAEGASRLEALRDPEPAPAAVQIQAPRAGEGTGTASKTIRVISHLGSATIVGDPTVATATAEGPHSARQDGDGLTIELGPLGRDDTFSFGPASRLVNGLGRNRESLIVRMNPDLALFARVRAGDVRVVGVHGPMTLEVQAGDCKVEDFRNVLNALVQAGSVSASGRLDGGSSTVKCQMGEVKLNLQKGSSVRIAARSTLGDVSIDGSGIRRGEAGRDVQIGSGAGTLDLECTMGDIKVNAE